MYFVLTFVLHISISLFSYPIYIYLSFTVHTVSLFVGQILFSGCNSCIIFSIFALLLLLRSLYTVYPALPPFLLLSNRVSVLLIDVDLYTSMGKILCLNSATIELIDVVTSKHKGQEFYYTMQCKYVV